MYYICNIIYIIYIIYIHIYIYIFFEAVIVLMYNYLLFSEIIKDTFFYLFCKYFAAISVYAGEK